MKRSTASRTAGKIRSPRFPTRCRASARCFSSSVTVGSVAGRVWRAAAGSAFTIPGPSRSCASGPRLRSPGPRRRRSARRTDPRESLGPAPHDPPVPDVAAPSKSSSAAARATGPSPSYRTPFSPSRTESSTPPTPSRDHRQAGGGGLDGRDPEVLDPREQEGPAPGHQSGEFVVGHEAQEPDPVGGAQLPGAGLQGHFLRSGAGHVEPAPRTGAGLDRVIDAFVRHQGRHGKVAILPRGRRFRGPKALDVDRRDHHLHPVGIDVVEAEDPFADEVAVGDPAVDAIDRLAVPAAQPGRLALDHPAFRSHPVPEVVVETVPDVAHRRVAVAHVHGARRRSCTLGHAVAGAEHEVVVRQVQAVDPAGKNGNSQR